MLKRLMAVPVPEPPSVDAGDEVLFFDIHHRKHFYKQVARILLGTVVFVAIASLWMHYFAPLLSNRVTQLGTQPYKFLAVSPFWVVMTYLITLLLVCYLLYRAYYEWTHTYLLLTLQKLVIIKPVNFWLLLLGPREQKVGASKITGIDTHKPTFMELVWFKDCIGATISIIDQEGNKTSAFSGLKDVRNYWKLSAQIERVLLAYGRLAHTD